jgi:hypothetical protein
VNGEHLIVDDSGQMGFFFCLGGLTIRCVGEYRFSYMCLSLTTYSRFKFVLIDFADDKAPRKIGHTFSAPFKVYTPASYPGVLDSTVYVHSVI